MSEGILTYNNYWQDIPGQDWPEPGMVFICLDPQKRLGEKTWQVAVMGDGTLEDDIEALGLFWDLIRAIIFAEAYTGKLADGVEIDPKEAV